MVRSSGPGDLLDFDVRKASCTSLMVIDSTFIGGGVSTARLLSTLSGGKWMMLARCFCSRCSVNIFSLIKRRLEVGFLQFDSDAFPFCSKR